MKAIRILGIAVLVLMLAGLVLGTACGGANGKQGAKGVDGVGVENIVNNGNGTFTVNLTDGSSYTTDNLTGPQGPKGDTGATGATGSKGDKGDPGAGLDPSYDTVAANEGTDTTWTDLATVGPTVTVTIGTSGSALVTLTASINVAGTDANRLEGRMGFSVSGATTISPSDEQALTLYSDAGELIQGSATFVVTGLNAGSNTFTAKYSSYGSSIASTVWFADRTIIVTPLP